VAQPAGNDDDRETIGYERLCKHLGLRFTAAANRVVGFREQANVRFPNV
jgi:hypothetical protein